MNTGSKRRRRNNGVQYVWNRIGQAAAQAAALRDAFREQEGTLATKADLAELRADLCTDVQSMRTVVTQLDARFAQMDMRFAQMDARLMHWMLAGASVGGISGGLVAAGAKIF